MNKEADNTYRLEDIGLCLPEILIPANHVDYNKWSVVACDQFTSQPEYWESVERYVGDNPSSLRIILPEAYLDSRRSKDSATQKEYTAKISENMAKYLNDNTLRNIGRCAVFTERTHASGKKRNGLVLAIDLEKYDYAPTSDALIRPSEYTVPERLPPRVAIRRKALIEAPHTILLFNDKKGEAFRYFEEAIAPFTSLAPTVLSASPVDKLYDFDLMMDGGHLTGYRFDMTEHAAVFDGFVHALMKSSSSDHHGPLFIVGDGNHSLAAAKLLWEELKSAGAGMSHPARYSLVEIENIHDSSIGFESIHRAVFGISTKKLAILMQRYAPFPFSMKFVFNEHADAAGARIETGSRTEADGRTKADGHAESYTVIPFKSTESNGYIKINTMLTGVAIHVLQKSLDDISANMLDSQKHTSGIKIDYVHGADALEVVIGGKKDATGFYMPEISKDSFFDTIEKTGRFPLKSFSIGHATEKRYYLESRQIIQKASS